ncbi:D-alanyl-D-alanine carboxypeptidase/D-alanyl-D-alanine-endopeptidase [Hydrogenophaga sp.]|uniref:D-alanyl-D-alanine carboxypeptidase/D-alanyl-D-alanine endopeptidase n=1 Tax=Hydrogenophaga sp. TaxID=1904254 RepID=UPI0025C4E9F0|nr:D-alanyl-D-alanine carboxypeptidase/D-alanyl-D-alanine-endopeptidase [Hydrogenophaga sp.]
MSLRRAARPALAGWLLAAASAWALPAAAQALPPDDPLPPAVRAALARADVPPSAFSALVVTLGPQPRERLRHRAHAVVNPASVMKLVTTYAAIDLLGPDFTWHTDFYAGGPVSHGVLRGNLYVRGGGDPKLVYERLQAAFGNLQQQGVYVILGDLVLDHSAFDLPVHDPGAFDGAALRPYNAGPDALLVNFRTVELRFAPDQAAGVARVSSVPPLQGLAIDAQVPLSRAPCGNWRAGLQARFDDANAIRFEGQFPQRCGEQSWSLAYQEPASHAARALEGLWRAGGGALTGSVRAGRTPAGARLLHEARSLPLSEIIDDVNRLSNNVMAQQVFLTLGQLAPERINALTVPRERLTPVRVGGFERSREVMHRWWHSTFGTRYATPVLDNGSGLSRDERITPEALVSLLRHADSHPQGEQFTRSLALAGVKGTAARMARGEHSAARGNAWLKTGTLRDVSGIAGYVFARSGTRLAVVAIINHPNAPAARPALEALLEWSASQAD